MGEDPIRDGLNWYGYCGGNPVSFVDPWGKSREKYEMSDGAKKYIEYYTNKLEHKEITNEQYNVTYDRIIEADKNNEIEGIYYDVPLYEQGNYGLCWAFCQVMVESYFSSSELSNDEATKQAFKLSGNKSQKAGLPSGSIIRIRNFSELVSNLKSRPLYASYAKETYVNGKKDRIGHCIVVCGAFSAEGLDDIVITNNPWGEQNIQSYSDFLDGIPNDNYGMKLEFYIKPTYIESNY